MSKIVFDLKLIQYMGLFEKLTSAKVKDCIVEESQIVFIVEPNEMGKAIGRGGENIKRIERAFKKRVKLAEYSPEVVTFIKNLITPLTVKEIIEEEGVFTLVPSDSQTRGYLIGRNASALRSYEEILKRHFSIKELKVSHVEG